MNLIHYSLFYFTSGFFGIWRWILWWMLLFWLLLCGVPIFFTQGFNIRPTGTFKSSVDNKKMEHWPHSVHFSSNSRFLRDSIIGYDNQTKKKRRRLSNWSWLRKRRESAGESVFNIFLRPPNSSYRSCCGWWSDGNWKKKMKSTNGRRRRGDIFINATGFIIKGRREAWRQHPCYGHVNVLMKMWSRSSRRRRRKTTTITWSRKRNES